MIRILFALVAVMVFQPDAQAGPVRRLINRNRQEPTRTPQFASSSPISPQPAGEAVDALDAVNAARAARGLKPYLRDENLTIAARGAALYRARHWIRDHIPGGMGDFQFLPPGTRAGAAGCGAVTTYFFTCCLYENWTYAGAATVRGSDGRYYHHLFVR